MIVVLSILFILNILLAFALKSLFSGDRWIKPLLVRLFLLIPPVSITILFCVAVYVLSYSLYSLVVDYLSDNQ